MRRNSVSTCFFNKANGASVFRDAYEIGSEYHLSRYFNLNWNRDANTFEYEYKTIVSVSDFYSDIYPNSTQNAYY